MTDSTPKKRNAIGDWSDYSPEVVVVSLPPIAGRDPRDYDDEVAREIVIRKRRAAGLPDYPPRKGGDDDA